MLSMAAASRRVIASSAGPISMTWPWARRLPIGSAGSPRAASATWEPGGTSRMSAWTASRSPVSSVSSKTTTDGPEASSSAAMARATGTSSPSGSIQKNGRSSRCAHWDRSVVLP